MSVVLPRYILDASIAMMWMFVDEDHVAEARAILRDFQRGDFSLLAPDHLYHEVINALRTGIRMRRITADDARAAVQDFLALSIPTVSGSSLYTNAFEYALRFDCAYYDGLYLVLAENENCPIIHADRRLRNTLDGRFPRELWIQDYTSIERDN